MASISTNQSNGSKRIIFVDGKRARRVLHLGAVPIEEANEVKAHVEELLAAEKRHRLPANATARWRDDLDDAVLDRLAAVGLAPARVTAAATGGSAKPAAPVKHQLGPFFDAYIADRTDAKPRTITNLTAARNDLVKRFGASKELADITAGDAEEFARWMRRPKAKAAGEGGRGLAENTTNRVIGRAQQLFAYAIRKRVVKEDPFAELDSKVSTNTARDFQITRPMADAITAACESPEWRLIFNLLRYGGLRCPSELVPLRWGDVDWENNRLTVHSPKTERYKGKEKRTIPIFPELRPHLLEALERAEVGSEFIITRYRRPDCNLAAHFGKIVKRAGLERWENLFHNLRRTRQNELEEIYPTHVVCAWMGNDEKTARKHYLRVTDAHFAKAVGPIEERSARESARKGSEQAGQ
jgi:integrase